MKLLHLLLAMTLAMFSAVTFAEPVDINTATAKELADGVHGLGMKKAEAIVKYREANGSFKSINDLAKVKGIKEKYLESLLADKRNQLTVGEVTSTPAATEAAPTDAAAAAEAEEEAPAAQPTPAAEAAVGAAKDAAALPAAAQDAAAAAKEAVDAAQKAVPPATK